MISFVKHLIVLDLSDCKTSGIHLAISSCASQMILSEFPSDHMFLSPPHDQDLRGLASVGTGSPIKSLIACVRMLKPISTRPDAGGVRSANPNLMNHHSRPPASLCRTTKLHKVILATAPNLVPIALPFFQCQQSSRKQGERDIPITRMHG